MNSRLFHTIAILCLILAQSAIAQIPHTISFQGLLTDGSGTPVSDGTHQVGVRIYDVATGGAPLFGETHSVATVGGVFNIYIGSSTPLPTSLGFDAPYFVGLTVDGGAELAPRTPMASVPYALNAVHAISADSVAGGVVNSLNGLDGIVHLVDINGNALSSTGNTITVPVGGNGLQGVQSVDGTIGITSPNGPVATLSLANNAVTSAKIADGTIRGIDIAPMTIPPSKIDPGSATNGQAIMYDGADVVFGNVGLTLPYTATVSTTNAFQITNNGTGSSGVFRIGSTTNTSNALMGETVAASGWSGPAGVFGRHTGNSGIGVLGEATGTSSNGIPPRGVYGVSSSGVGVYGVSSTGTGVIGSADSTGVGLLGYSNGSGNAAQVRVNNTSSSSEALSVETNGSGHAIYAERTATSGTRATIMAENASTSNGSGIVTGVTAVQGVVTPTGGGGWSAGVRGINNSTTGNGIGVVGYQAGSGWGVVGETAGGIGVRAVSGANGNALVAIYTGTNASSTTADNIAIFQAPPRTGGAAVNQARIDAIGRGYFNNGTLNSGADVAEMFDVEGERADYEPGDVLVISTSSDRTVEKSAEAYSALVVGVYATKPGVMLSERTIDADHSDLVPMGVVGVIPTKVCDENGAIHRGDLLVTSSLTGHAMRADAEQARQHPGAVIGKALENFDDASTGTIKVLVNVR